MNISNRKEYSYVAAYIAQHDLENARKAMALMDEVIANEMTEYDPDLETQRIRAASLRREHLHSLYIARMLMDMHFPFNKEDMDLMITVGLCHTLTEGVVTLADPYELMESRGIDPKAGEILSMISGRYLLGDIELRQYYERIQRNPIALMIVLIDRGSILQGLHHVSSWLARRNIYETKTYYFPMCIYAKEQYPELLGCINTLMEKLRNLVELTEMMLNRYEDRENELLQEILALKEENAAIKGIIQRMTQV